LEEQEMMMMLMMIVVLAVIAGLTYVAARAHRSHSRPGGSEHGDERL
jgi:heme/copper-type cytochrome/quinol oxidase subunit 2